MTHANYIPYMVGVYQSVFVRPCASRPLIDGLLVCWCDRDVAEWQVASMSMWADKNNGRKMGARPP